MPNSAPVAKQGPVIALKTRHSRPMKSASMAPVGPGGRMLPNAQPSRPLARKTAEVEYP